MIMGLDFEGDRQSVAYVDDPGVLFSGPNKNPRGPGGKCSKERAAVFVGAMLAPHHREYAQLRVSRLPPKNTFKLFVLLGGEIVPADEVGP